MKKILIIEFLPGNVKGNRIERDITNDLRGVPLGAPANDSSYAQLCQQISVGGYTNPEHSTATEYQHIAPSQIKSVTIKFEK